ncbi:MAG TPA: SagB/ThcOx family dehydrogenase [candidate division WOR-3 bacterium]|uniref:SagB/ThcOx family dehydrogenase n=1 Tax=candidate division WOR-3 bacterium TaxID=2052148 RepID=A0A9C9EL15_UNCW3|nr:SagB/ThcOx family dehydrogenase [candidate division WOR-3 bacterium]
MIRLPEPKFTNKSIEECIRTRRSIRDFKDKEIPLAVISNILWAAQGITDEENGFRAAPSAGATYPLEIFYATKDGFFRYIPESHGVTKEQDGDLRKAIAHAALEQNFIAEAGMVIVIAAIFGRTTGRYGERGIRYVYNEVGHCAQNIHLEAVAAGLGSVPIGAFDDLELKGILAFVEEDPLYIIPVGYPR